MIQALPLAALVVVWLLSLGGCAERLGHRYGGAAEGSCPLPPSVTKVVIQGGDGHITVQAGPPGEVRWQAKVRLAADSAALLQQLKASEPNLVAVDLAEGATTLILRGGPAGGGGARAEGSLPAHVAADTAPPRGSAFGPNTQVHLLDPARAICALEVVVFVPPDLGIEVSSLNGNLAAVDRKGAVRLSAKRGDVWLNNVEGAGDVFARRGKVLVVGHRGDLKVEVGAGDIQAKLAAFGPNGVDLHCEAGPVRCTLPEAADCTVDGLTQIGRSIRPEGLWPEVKVAKDGYSSSMRGTIGLGGPPVRIRGGSSNISIAPPVRR